MHILTLIVHHVVLILYELSIPISAEGTVAHFSPFTMSRPAKQCSGYELKLVCGAQITENDI